MYAGVQASLMRTVKSSPSTIHRARLSCPSAEKRTKNKDNLANAKLIPTILPDYIPPLAIMVNCDSVLGYFEYTIVTA
jgi:hypothetical protein